MNLRFFVVKSSRYWRGICVAWLIMLTGCRTTPTVPPPSETPTYAQLAAAHNERALKLNNVYASGVIEIRRRGRVLPDQGDMELWLQQPRSTAVRVNKMGEVLLWIGSDDERYWVFDRTGAERTLFIGRHESPDTAEEAGLAVQPLVLLDLMGITSIPAEDSNAAVQFSSQHNAWMVQTQGRAGPLRMYFDRTSRLPARVEALDAAGAVAAHATLGRYEGVRQEGMSLLAFPRMPQTIDIAGAAGEHIGGQVKIVISEATGVIDPSEFQRVFDLDRLRQALRPERVQEQ